jgi:hypothetical protein
MKTHSCKLGLTTLAVFATVFAFDGFYHGMLLKSAYEATASLWRPEAEMEQMFMWCLAMHAAVAFLFVWLFTRNYEGKGIGEGIRFGLPLGALLGVLNAGAYIYMPIPESLALAWLVGGILRGVVMGIVCALVYGYLCRKGGCSA